MRRVWVLVIIPLVLLNISGCAPLLIGVAAGGVGIYASGRDTIQGETDKPYDSLWNAALDVSKTKGAIKQEDYVKGYIELDAGSTMAWIRLIRLTRATTRVRISARKYHLPNLPIAQEIFAKILEEAR